MTNFHPFLHAGQPRPEFESNPDPNPVKEAEPDKPDFSDVKTWLQLHNLLKKMKLTTRVVKLDD